jgi:hypothetical protein
VYKSLDIHDIGDQITYFTRENIKLLMFFINALSTIFNLVFKFTGAMFNMIKSAIPI